MTAFLEAALDYAARGWPVFPLQPKGKQPVTKRGLHDATTDPEKIGRWWRRTPEANIGVRCGPIIVIDVDDPATFHGLAEQHRAEIPKTLTARTGGGGFHLVFTAPDFPVRNSAGKLAPGVDVRGEGGYIVAAPSVHETGGRYEWTSDADPTPLPDWLAELLRPAKNGSQPPGPIMTTSETTPYGRAALEAETSAIASASEGTRNDTLNNAALKLGSLVAGGELAEADARPALEAAAHACGLPVREAAATIESGLQAGIEEPRRAPERPSPSSPARHEEPKSIATGGLVWRRLSEIAMRPIIFLDRPLYQAAAFHLVVGRKNSGKGTMLAYEAARVTRGELGDRRSVVWIAAGEDSYSIDVRPRIEAAGGDVSRLTVLEEGRLVLPDHLPELLRLATEVADVGMFVVDPLGGSLGSGRNTNLDSDVRPALEALNRLADTTEAMVFGVRHISNKAVERGALASVLGSSDWVNVPRAVLAVVHDDDDEDVRHIQLVAGNRTRHGAGRTFRIAGHLLPGMTEEVTLAVMLGESSKDADELLTRRQPGKRVSSDELQALILAELADGEQPRKHLDEKTADQLGANRDSVYKYGIAPLQRAGRIKSRKDGFGGAGGWCYRLAVDYD